MGKLQVSQCADLMPEMKGSMAYLGEASFEYGSLRVMEWVPLHWVKSEGQIVVSNITKFLLGIPFILLSVPSFND